MLKEKDIKFYEKFIPILREHKEKICIGTSCEECLYVEDAYSCTLISKIQTLENEFEDIKDRVSKKEKEYKEELEKLAEEAEVSNQLVTSLLESMDCNHILCSSCILENDKGLCNSVLMLTEIIESFYKIKREAIERKYKGKATQ